MADSRNNKIPGRYTLIGGLALPAPGTVLAVFSADDGEEEITVPVLGLFIRTNMTEYGPASILDGFTAGGERGDLIPVSEVENFRGFRFSGATDSHFGGRESGKCRYCGNRSDTDDAARGEFCRRCDGKAGKAVGCRCHWGC